MINAKDLMIGDWVCTEHDSTPRQIDWIRTGEVGLFWNKVVTPAFLVPILLTSEILERNEFRLYGNEWQYHTEDDKGHILIEFSKDNNLSINIYNSFALKDDKGRADLVHFGRDWCDSFYIHELQNALRLCGIEHEIAL